MEAAGGHGLDRVRESVLASCRAAHAAAFALRGMPREEKDAVLESVASSLERNMDAVLAANARDVEAAEAAGLKLALVDRLALDARRYAAMVAGVRHVATLPDPAGETIWRRERPSGITISKVRVPLGVVAIVFESRPNVLVDSAALCLKAGDACVLRGGKEAMESNRALAAAVREGLCGGAAADAVQFIDLPGHEAVRELVRAEGLVDVAIPRGGEGLVRAVCEATLVPVLKHCKGVCHIYVDDKADLAMALAIIDDAKLRRPGACNAVECLLVHEKLAPLFLPMVEAWARGSGVTLHKGDAGVEYLSGDLNVETVADVDAAVAFVNANSSHHSDCIVTQDAERAESFLRGVDSACVYHNASTRFTDGGEFGMGAEIGISTDKFHARGPMGLEELTTYKYVVTGDGAVRG